MNWSALVGVVTMGNPVAPAFNGHVIVEVNCLCIQGDLDPMPRVKPSAAASRIITYVRC